MVENQHNNGGQGTTPPAQNPPPQNPPPPSPSYFPQYAQLANYVSSGKSADPRALNEAMETLKGYKTSLNYNVSYYGGQINSLRDVLANPKLQREPVEQIQGRLEKAQAGFNESVAMQKEANQLFATLSRYGSLSPADTHPEVVREDQYGYNSGAGTMRIGDKTVSNVVGYTTDAKGQVSGVLQRQGENVVTFSPGGDTLAIQNKASYFDFSSMKGTEKGTGRYLDPMSAQDSKALISLGVMKPVYEHPLASKNVEDTGQYVDTINQDIGGQALIAVKEGDLYRITINPNFKGGKDFDAMVEGRLEGYGFWKSGKSYVYLDASYTPVESNNARPVFDIGAVDLSAPGKASSVKDSGPPMYEIRIPGMESAFKGPTPVDFKTDWVPDGKGMVSEVTPFQIEGFANPYGAEYKGGTTDATFLQMTGPIRLFYGTDWVKDYLAGPLEKAARRESDPLKAAGLKLEAGALNLFGGVAEDTVKSVAAIGTVSGGLVAMFRAQTPTQRAIAGGDVYYAYHSFIKLPYTATYLVGGALESELQGSQVIARPMSLSGRGLPDDFGKLISSSLKTDEAGTMFLERTWRLAGGALTSRLYQGGPGFTEAAAQAVLSGSAKVASEIAAPVVRVASTAAATGVSFAMGQGAAEFAGGFISGFGSFGKQGNGVTSFVEPEILYKKLTGPMREFDKKLFSSSDGNPLKLPGEILGGTALVLVQAPQLVAAYAGSSEAGQRTLYGIRQGIDAMTSREAQGRILGVAAIGSVFGLGLGFYSETKPFFSAKAEQYGEALDRFKGAPNAALKTIADTGLMVSENVHYAYFLAGSDKAGLKGIAQGERVGSEQAPQAFRIMAGLSEKGLNPLVVPKAVNRAIIDVTATRIVGMSFIREKPKNERTLSPEASPILREFYQMEARANFSRRFLEDPTASGTRAVRTAERLPPELKQDNRAMQDAAERAGGRGVGLSIFSMDEIREQDIQKAIDREAGRLKTEQMAMLKERQGTRQRENVWLGEVEKVGQYESLFVGQKIGQKQRVRVRETPLPPGFGFKFDVGVGERMTKADKQAIREMTKYAPSLLGIDMGKIEKNITGRSFTGLEIRGIPKGWLRGGI